MSQPTVNEVDRIPVSLRRPERWYQGSPDVSGQDPRVTAVQKRYNMDPIKVQTGSPKVWLSNDQNKKPESEWPTVEQASTAYTSLSKDAFGKLVSTMDQYYGKGRWNASYIKNFWAEALQISSNALVKGEKIPVMDVFDNLLAQAAAAGLTPSGAGGGGGPKITQTVKLTDPQTAETIIDQALQQYLGRKASDTEVKSFRKALRGAEMESPSRVDTQGTTAITSGGFNPAVFAQQYAEGMEGAAEYQAATTFLDAFIGAIGPRVEL